MAEKISVIMPVYNTAPYLASSIRSVLETADGDLELIIVDDGSVDDSLAEIRRLAFGDARIRYFASGHKGVSVARNTGLDMATGDFVMFIDSDDAYDLDMIRQMTSAQLETAADLVVCSIRYLLPDGSENLHFCSLDDYRYGDTREFILDLLEKKAMLLYSNCNKLYKAEIIRNNNLRFPEGTGFGEDRLFNYQYIRLAKTVMTLSGRLYHYNMRSDTSSSRFISGRLPTLINLHAAKMGMIGRFVSSGKAYEDFKKADLLIEFNEGVRHVLQHRPEMTFTALYRECQLNIAADWSAYYLPLRGGGRWMRVFLLTIRFRLPLLMALLYEYRKARESKGTVQLLADTSQV